MKRTAAPFLQELLKNLASCLWKLSNTWIAFYREGCWEAQTVHLILQPEVESYRESCLCAAPWSPWCLPDWHSCVLTCRSAALNGCNSTEGAISINTLAILDVCFTHLPGSKDGNRTQIKMVQTYKYLILCCSVWTVLLTLQGCLVFSELQPLFWLFYTFLVPPGDGSVSPWADYGIRLTETALQCLWSWLVHGSYFWPPFSLDFLMLSARAGMFWKLFH